MFRDVHIYDGKLIGLFKPSRQYTMIEKDLLFEALSRRLKNPLALRGLSLISKERSGNTPNQVYSNYSNSNRLDASDILADIVANIRVFDQPYKGKIDTSNDNDLIMILEEQLADMRSLGTCAEGRCTRLLQVWMAVRNTT